MNDEATLIDAYFDGELSPAEARRLEAWLAESSDRRRLLAERALDHLLLRDVLLAAALRPDEPPAVKRAALRSRLWRMVTRPTPLSMTVAALVVGLFITAMAFIAAPIYSRLAQTPVDSEVPVFVGQLTNTHNAEWADGQIGTRLGAFLQAGHEMDLRHGLAEIELRNGARVVLEGPAKLTIDAVSQVSLERGRLTARVDAGARGFTVATAAVKFIDLGTEFGVDVLDANASEIHVFEGVVEAWVTGEAVAHRITQGGGLQVNKATGTTRRLVSPSHGFVRNLPQWVPIHVENASFEEPRLAATEGWRNGVPAWVNNLPGGGVSKFGPEFAQPVPDGVQMAFLNEGELTQVLAETLQPNTAYRLTVWVGNRPGRFSPNYSVELWAGDTELAKSENRIIPIKRRMAPVTLNYTTGDARTPAMGAPLKIVLRSHGSLATGTQNHFDLVGLHKLTIHSP